MITFRTSTEVPEDRRVTLTLPPEAPTGKLDLLVVIDPAQPQSGGRPGTSLADWAEQNAEDWGTQLSSEDVEAFTGRRFEGERRSDVNGSTGR